MKRGFLVLLLAGFFSVAFFRSAEAGWFSAICDAVADAVNTVVDAVVDVVKAVVKAILDALFELDFVADEELDEHCKSFEDYRNEHKDTENCDVCKIFMAVYDGADAVAKQISSTLSGPLRTLVITFGLVWIGFQTISFYSNVGAAPDPLEYLTQRHFPACRVRCHVFIRRRGFDI